MATTKTDNRTGRRATRAVPKANQGTRRQAEKPASTAASRKRTDGKAGDAFKTVHERPARRDRGPAPTKVATSALNAAKARKSARPETRADEGAATAAVEVALAPPPRGPAGQLMYRPLPMDYWLSNDQHTKIGTVVDALKVIESLESSGEPFGYSRQQRCSIGALVALAHESLHSVYRGCDTQELRGDRPISVQFDAAMMAWWLSAFRLGPKALDDEGMVNCFLHQAREMAEGVGNMKPVLAEFEDLVRAHKGGELTPPGVIELAHLTGARDMVANTVDRNISLGRVFASWRSALIDLGCKDFAALEKILAVMQPIPSLADRLAEDNATASGARPEAELD